MSGNSQRVRIGLTGLAFVFVLVMLAAVFSKATDEAPITANGIEEASGGKTLTEAADEVADEPLAELGVAPGKAPEVDNAATAETIPVEDPLRPQRRR